jgi:hypothetical protein
MIALSTQAIEAISTGIGIGITIAIVHPIAWRRGRRAGYDEGNLHGYQRRMLQEAAEADQRRADMADLDRWHRFEDIGPEFPPPPPGDPR